MSFLDELKRRNVFRVAVAYLAVGWLILQFADLVFENINAPDWVMQALMFLLAAGFPVAALFAWAFEMTPEGIKREKDVDRSESITRETGQKLNRMIIGVLVVAVALLLVDKFALREQDHIDTAATDKSVAVLPFVAMSRGDDDEYFADGLTEEILNSLTRVPELLVTARTSSFHFKGQDIPIPDIAEELGVAHIVEGSVRREGDRLRVTAQLIRAADGFHLWSENYDRETRDTFGVQTDIAEKIASALGIFLDGDTVEEMRSAGFRNPEAYVAYQKSVQLYNDAHNNWDIVPHLAEANTWLDRVIDLEPNASRAYLLRVDYNTHRLSDNYSKLSEEERREAVAGFRADLDAAVNTATDNVSRAAARFDRAVLTGDWRAMHAVLEEYAQLAECPTAAWLNANTLEYGQTDKVLELGERLITCDPHNPFGWWYAAQALQWKGEFDRAIELTKQAFETVEHGTLWMSLFHSYLGARRFDDAEYLLSQFNEEREALADRYMSLAAARGDAERVATELDMLIRHRGEASGVVLNFLPRSGDREAANRIAAEFDAKPYGYISLMSVPSFCMCGAPWDIEVTPNFKRRIEDAGFAWPPASPIEWPLKDW
jgi:TolB-like protein/tetratricopeptide (TPR) repeat protein